MDMPTNSPEAQPQEAPDCPHLVVTMYPTKGRFASPQRYWSCQDCGADFAPSRADLPRTTLAELDVWDRLNERRHELIHLKRQQGFLEERDEMNFNALQWVAGLVRELVAGQPFQVNDNSTTTTPRATGETTVEAALAELREMFPGKVIMVRREDSFYPPDRRDAAETNSMVTIKIGYLRSEPKFRSFRSLADCMAQVRAASRTEGKGEKANG